MIITLIRSRPQMVYVLRAFAFLLTALLAVAGNNGASIKPVNGRGSEDAAVSPKARKLLISPNTTTTTTTTDYNSGGSGSIDRIGMGDGMECSKDSILIFQGATTPLPSGIPTYSVDVENACLSESCSISAIHLSCGWFSSARLVDPSIFRRIGYDDCLVNDGKPLNPGESISFQYADTFQYPLSVSSVSCT